MTVEELIETLEVLISINEDVKDHEVKIKNNKQDLSDAAYVNWETGYVVIETDLER